MILYLSFGAPYFLALALAGSLVEEFWFFTGSEQRRALAVTVRVIEPLMKFGGTITFSHTLALAGISIVEGVSGVFRAGIATGLILNHRENYGSRGRCIEVGHNSSQVV